MIKYTFDHIALSVSDVARALEFYSATFDGVTILYQDETWALIELSGLKIAFVITGQHPPHISLRVADRPALEAEAERTGKTIVRHRDQSESFYITDPDENAIEILAYPSDK